MLFPAKDNFMKKMLIGVLFSVLALILISHSALADYKPGTGVHDFQEAIIKQVLSETGKKFGWDQRACFYSISEYSTMQGIKERRIRHCPRIEGPNKQYDFSRKDSKGNFVQMNCSAYLFDMEIPPTGIKSGGTLPKDTCALEISPMKIIAFPSVSLAAASMKDDIKSTLQANNTVVAKMGKKWAAKIIKFHGNDAIYDISGLSWQSERFIFSVSNNSKDKFLKGTSVDVPYMEVANALFNNAVSYGLIGQGVSIQDSDGDGVPDTIDKCPNTKAGTAVDADGCPAKMQMSLGTDKNTYSPGETVIISGSVWDAKGGLDGATVVVDVDGTRLAATGHSTGNFAGKYECQYSLPARAMFGNHTVTATASYSGYPGSISKSTSFAVGKTKIEIEIEKIIPVPGEVPVTITALDQNGHPIKGVIKIAITDKNNNDIYFTKLEKTTGYTLDNNGKYSTKFSTWNPGERKTLGGYTYLKDIPLNATIKVEIRDKANKISARENKIVPFNLSVIHGVTVDNKSLKPVNQNFKPKLGLPGNMVFKEENSENGNFWVLVKPYNFNYKKSIKDMMDQGRDVTLTWDEFNPMPLIYSIEKAPQAGEVLELGKVSKTPLELILSWYVIFGSTPHTWPDGTKDQKALTGPYSNGAENNFYNSIGDREAARFNCVSMQYRTLWFLNHVKDKKAKDEKAKFLSKLKGWAYSPVYGVTAYPEHNAVALWERIKNPIVNDNKIYGPLTHAIILDPHGKQKPYWYSADTVIFEWHIDKGMEKNYVDTGWKPPWPKPNVKIKKTKHELVEVHCPVDLLVVNSQSQRFGILSNGDKVAEFKPIYSYFWQDKIGDKQWFLELPDDAYTINITGTGSGNFHLLTYTPENGGHDYGENPIEDGQQATLTIGPKIGDRLILANGKEIKPSPLIIGSKSPNNTIAKRTAITPIADAYVYAYSYRNWNRSNRGRYDQMVAGWHPTGGESRAYIKFDLSHIDPAQINKAVLKLFHFQTKSGNGIDLGIYRITSPWKEGTDTYHSGRTEKTAAPGEISWVQQPTIDPAPIAMFNPGSGLYDWTKVNITPLVKKWLSGTPNYGLVIKPVNHRQESVYYFASRERIAELDKPKGKSKAPVLILSENTNVNNGISQTSQQIPNTGLTKNTFSCAHKDNVEIGCCCFKGAHTYRFASRYVTNVLARFDTGRGFNCQSTVNLDVDRGNGWETVKTVQTNSSREGSERAPIEIVVSVNDKIKGFRISDECACCIDSSEITLNAGPFGGNSPQSTIFQHALGKPCAPDKEFVRSLFQSILERDLDVSFAPGHGTAHLRSLQNGASREAVTKAFFNSPEYKKRQKSNQEFIRDVYQSVLGREPNSAELNRRIGVNRNDFISTLFNRTEYRKITAGCLHNNGDNPINSGMTPLPFFEDFSQGASRWTFPSGVSLASGHVVWNTGNFNAVKLNSAIPMEDIIIEFDGYAETNGINVWLQNDEKKGYTVILGGWYNTQSGSDIGANTENRELVHGKVWVPQKWQHYKIVRSGNVLEAYCNNQLIFSRSSERRFNGYGHLRFDSYNALIGIDNIHIYRAKKSDSQNTLGQLVSGSYQVDHRVGGTTWHSTWVLNAVDGRITGTSEWSCCPGHRIDPMNGKILGNSVIIERDCSKQGYNGPCKQIYKGKFKNGHIEGIATGTGLGSENHWILYLNSQP